MKILNSSFKKTLLASLVVPFALGAQLASAGVLVTEWSYEVDSSFTDFTETGGTGGDVTGVNTNTLSWGVPFVSGGDKSSLNITDVPLTGGLQTNSGDFVSGGEFTHTNNVILASGKALSSFDLTSVLTLTPTLPSSGAPNERPATTFESFFIETSNVSNENCGFESTSDCDDIFTLGDLTGLGAIENDDGTFDFTSSFIYDDYNYTVFLRLVGLTTLSDEACTEAAGVPSTGCVGLQTLENGDTTFQTKFRIDGVAVPEPGTLALLGLGLAGLSMSRRRSAAK